jgi:hypothetical protein
MAGTGCCVEVGEDLKKTRSCDSTPESTEDCDEGGSLLSGHCPASDKRGEAYHNCRSLISGKFALCEILYLLARRDALFVDVRARAKAIDV